MQLVCLSGLGCVGHRAIVGEFGYPLFTYGQYYGGNAGVKAGSVCLIWCVKEYKRTGGMSRMNYSGLT